MTQFTSRNPASRRMLPPSNPPRGGGVTASVVTSTGTVTVTNTTIETTLVALTLPAGAFTAGRAAFATVGGTFKHTGSTGSVILRLKMNAATILTTPLLVPSTSPNQRGWRIDTTVIAATTAVQQTSATFVMSEGSTGTWPAGTSGYTAVGYGVSTQPSTATIAVTVTAQFATASTGWIIEKNVAMLQQVR